VGTTTAEKQVFHLGSSRPKDCHPEQSEGSAVVFAFAVVLDGGSKGLQAPEKIQGE
jgi:hypothetical protein